MISYSECPVCRSGDFAFAFEAKDYSISGETFKVSECSKCSHRFTNPVPDQNEIGKYYESTDYISHSNTSKGIVNKAYQFVRNYTLGSKRKLIRNFSGKSSGNLLDYGCGTGEFLNTMKTSGWNVTGIEPGDSAREMAIKNYGLDVKRYEELQGLDENRFDVITLWHVLEHVHELKPVIQKINRLLKPDGCIIVAVPNYKSTDAELYKKYWAAYDLPRHLYHFSPQSMNKLLTDNGMELAGKRIMPFDSFYVSMLSEKYKSGGMMRGVWIGFRSWLKALFSTDKCSSLIYLVKKKSLA